MSIMSWTGKASDADYINRRWKGLQGRTVVGALQHYKYKYERKLAEYRSADLSYDLKAGRLTLPLKSGLTVAGGRHQE